MTVVGLRGSAQCWKLYSSYCPAPIFDGEFHELDQPESFTMGDDVAYALDIRQIPVNIRNVANSCPSEGLGRFIAVAVGQNQPQLQQRRYAIIGTELYGEIFLPLPSLTFVRPFLFPVRASHYT